MKNFVNSLTDFIIKNERPKLENIMNEVSINIQKDFVNVTYAVIDKFYQDYMPPERSYIRVDEYREKHRLDKNGRKHNKNGSLAKMSETEKRRKKDVSLMSAIKSLDESGNAAIGVCDKLGDLYYHAGVLFSEKNLASKMRHAIKGKNFTEWDIVEDFLWGVHGNDNVYTTTPSAGWVLYEYLNSYKTRFDMHYKNACKHNKK